jgi:hypothetical protein
MCGKSTVRPEALEGDWSRERRLQVSRMSAGLSRFRIAATAHRGAILRWFSNRERAMTSTVLTEAIIMSCIDMLRHGGSEAIELFWK